MRISRRRGGCRLGLVVVHDLEVDHHFDPVGLNAELIHGVQPELSLVCVPRLRASIDEGVVGHDVGLQALRLKLLHPLLGLLNGARLRASVEESRVLVEILISQFKLGFPLSATSLAYRELTSSMP